MIANLHMAFISRFIFPAFVCGFALHAADQPQWGSAWTRNMVSDEKGLPDSFDPETGRNILWIAPLGTHSHATPIVAGGRVYVGTNNARPRDPQQTGDRGVLLCLDEKDGSLLWQLVVPKREDDKYFDWPEEGICSPVTVEGDRAYVVTNRHEVLCLDVAGMANGNDGPFKDELVISSSHLAATSRIQPILADASSAQIEPGPKTRISSGSSTCPRRRASGRMMARTVRSLCTGDFLYVNTGAGVDNSHKVIRTPDAPSLIVLEKKTGRYVAREREGIAPNIFHSTGRRPHSPASAARSSSSSAAATVSSAPSSPCVQARPQANSRD
jgi:hypothetical protein